MARLWRAFEESPGLMDVAEMWNRRLGTEFESLRRIFSVTDVVAARYPADEAHRHLRIVADERAVVGIDDETGEQHSLSRRDIACHRLNVRALARELCDALGFAHRFEKLESTYHTTRIGALPARFESRPVYLHLGGTGDGLRRAVELAARHASRSYLMLHPSARPATSDIENLIRLKNGCLMQLEDLVEVDVSGRFVPNRDPQRMIAESLGIAFESASPRYLFKLGSSELRILAFDSDPVIVKDSVGLRHIARLLAAPHVPLNATHLESLETGIDASVSSGSKGEHIDPRAVQEYRTRLSELDTEIEEAASFHDLSRLEKLQHEREQFEATLRKATGLGGKVREDFDAERARKNASRAIRRAINKIEIDHPALARHLDDAIDTGMHIVYSPPSRIDWTL